MLKEEFDAMNAKKDFSSLLATVGLSTNRNTFPFRKLLVLKFSEYAGISPINILPANTKLTDIV